MTAVFNDRRAALLVLVPSLDESQVCSGGRLRITAPAIGVRVELGGIDLSSTELYCHGDAHLAWQARGPSGRSTGMPLVPGPGSGR
jgi:hypothetical protein